MQAPKLINKQLTLEKIKQPIALEMKEFELCFRDALKTKVALLDRITYYLAHRKGKQMRPMFVLLSAKIFGDINASTYRAASMVELLHTATLVHDDVVDDSMKRRSFFSINALWKNKIAVLVGDYLFSRGLLISVEHKEYEVLELLSNTIKQMSEGELLQMSKARKLDITEDVYYEIIRKKTASFVGAACAVGAQTASQDAAAIEHMSKLGEAIGMAFQIKDDLLDYGKGGIGKPVGIDIKEKKLTLPIIHAMNNASRAEKRAIARLIKRGGKKKSAVRRVIDFAEEKGGIAYAQERMLEYRTEAVSMLRDLPQNDARDALEQLLIFVTERKK
ncbi:MAG: polyprenyl synthetase family protein [Saprospiraceae bacterium]|nr:polyprenyl synthetase family protein [Saprospiraceae bacterium]